MTAYNIPCHVPILKVGTRTKYAKSRGEICCHMCTTPGAHTPRHLAFVFLSLEKRDASMVLGGRGWENMYDAPNDTLC